MGLTKKFKELSKEYLNDPYGQFFRNLDKLVDIGLKQGIAKDEILRHVKNTLYDERK